MRARSALRQSGAGSILRPKERDPSSTAASPERASTLNWFGVSAGRAGFQDNLA